MREAGPAEILRGAQKDEEFIRNLQHDVREIVQRVQGDAWWLHWHRRIDGAATCAYYLLTTVSGLQTLGEEYAGIVQVDGSRHVPGLLRRLALAALLTLGPAAAAVAVRRADQRWPQRRVAAVAQLLHQLHITLFYLRAGYYHPEKRLIGVRYLLVRPWMGDATSRRTFRILGLISLAHLCISAAIQLRGIAAPHPASVETSSGSAGAAGLPTSTGDLPTSTGDLPTSTAELPASADGADSGSVPRRLQCPLCLCRRTATAATPCGHLFCWTCAVDWLQTQPNCPVCRDDAPPHRLVPLVGFSED